MRMFREAKLPSKVSTKNSTYKVRNTYLAGDIYDSHSGTYEQEDTYSKADGNGYILDKAGNEYPIRTKEYSSDAGRLAGGTRNYSVEIILAEDLHIFLSGYSAIFSNPHYACIVADLKAGYYLEDYLAKNKGAIQFNSTNQSAIEDLIKNGDPNAKSASTIKQDREDEREAKFNSRYLRVFDYLNKSFPCKIEDGKVVAKKRTLGESPIEIEVSQNIKDMVTVLFEINGYTFKDFEGASFYATLDDFWNLEVRYDTVKKEFIAYEVKNGKIGKEVDFSRISVKIENIKIKKDCPFGQLILKTHAKSLGRKSDFITASAIEDKAYDLMADWGRKGKARGYYSLSYGFGTSEKEMRKKRSDAKKFAKEELAAEFEKMKDPSSFTYEALKKAIELLPKKVLTTEAPEVIETPVTPSNFVPDAESTKKMTAWHNGERKQNVKACADAKLKNYYKTCKALGFETEAEILKKEAENRGMVLGESRRRF